MNFRLVCCGFFVMLWFEVWVDKEGYDIILEWYGMICYGMVWYGMLWNGMVWYGMVW